MARLWNKEVEEVLRNRIGGEPISAAEIVRITDLSYSTVRKTLNVLYDSYLAERDLDRGLHGHAIHRWYWIGE